MSTTTTPDRTNSDSTSTHTTDGDPDQSDGEQPTAPSKAERLASYLRAEAADGETYFKAKFISEDVDLSPKEIGALIVQLQDSLEDLTIEKWSYTGATTWRVTTQ